MRTLNKLFFLISSSEKKKAVLLLFMIIIMAIIDMIGVASILPFVAVLTNPSLIETNFILNNVFQVSKKFGIQNNHQFFIFIGVFFLLLLIISLTFKAITTYVQLRFIQLCEYSIGRRLLKAYLQQPYSLFLSRNTSYFRTNILSEVQEIINAGMTPIMELISKGLIAILLIFLLIMVNPKLAFTICISLGCVYFLIIYFVKNYLHRIGQGRTMNNQLRFKVINEAFGALKEIKFGGLEEVYIKNFSNSAKFLAKTTASAKIIAMSPRFILEAAAFGGIIILILYLLTQTGDFNSALPILSLYIFVGYRLMPILQQIYVSITGFSFVSPSLDKIYFDLKKFEPLNKDRIYTQAALPLNKTISLKNISYNYPNSNLTVLDNINLTINAKSCVGLVGSTGSGKTTLVDIILGLLEAYSGRLEVDGEAISNENLKSWQRSIGYVPQNIYLSDDFVKANIAFGVELKNINEDLVIKVSKIANLHDFVMNKLPKKYETTIGERGVRLSGGERQRIGIARALYHNPKVLILDEATSALDNQTEKIIMEAINNLSKNVTVILIAHRLNTVKKCEKIFLLDKGKLKREGTYTELFQLNDFSNNNY